MAILNEIPKEVTLIAVSKTKPVEMIMECYNIGQRDFGENKVQDLIAKKEVLPKDIRWHFIGKLQTNKVKYLVNNVHLIHSLSSIKLLEKIESEFGKNDLSADVLIQINIGREESKSGIYEEELEEMIKAVESCNHVKVKGLMVIIPKGTDEENRYYFRKTKKIFDSLKEKYGRDIFGQGYIYKLIDDSELAIIDDLTEDEKINGISENKNYYVLYDKGDKDGNRWYLETPFAIAWTKENVKILQTDPKARWQGYNFFFKTGFCWSDINTTYLKCRLKGKSIHDVKSMSLFSLSEKVPNYYLISLINSKFISLFVDDFVNNTQTFQINDARQLPIIVPTNNQLKRFEDEFNKAYQIKKQQFANEISEKDANELLKPIEQKIDLTVYKLYKMSYEEILIIDKNFTLTQEEYDKYEV